MADDSVQEISIRDASIELAQLLKFGGLVDTGGAAKQVISAGEVTVNGEVETQRGKTIVPGDRVAYDGRTLLVVRGR